MKNQRRREIILRFISNKKINRNKSKIPYYVKLLNIHRKAELAGTYRPNYFDD